MGAIEMQDMKAVTVHYVIARTFLVAWNGQTDETRY